MNPEVHKLYTEFSQSTVAYKKMRTIRNVHQLEHFVKTHYKCLFEKEIDACNRSFDYRYGIWYRKIMTLHVYYNVLEHHLNFRLHSRIVDKRFVDRTTPVIVRKHLRPRRIVVQLREVLTPHLRTEACEALEQALVEVNSRMFEELWPIRATALMVLGRHRVPSQVQSCIMDFVY